MQIAPVYFDDCLRVMTCASGGLALVLGFSPNSRGEGAHRRDRGPAPLYVSRMLAVFGLRFRRSGNIG